MKNTAEKETELSTKDATTEWHRVGAARDFPKNSGACVKLGQKQIAVYRFDRDGKWFATDNLCPHKQEMVLSRGLLGEAGNRPFVACPLHKKRYSLEDGQCLDQEEFKIQTYAVKVEDGFVYIGFSEYI